MRPVPTRRLGAVGAGERQRLLAKKRAENFPVALRILPRSLRRDLGALYEVARVIDDLGDESGGDRTAALLRFREDLARAWDGQPREPVLRRLVPAIRARGLELEPFDRLVQANLQDQEVTRYATQAELEDYCVLSANPVGRIVLRIFGVRSAGAERLSDLVCTALQLLEHCQDVAEDHRAGRIYLPQRDLAAFGVDERDLAGVRPAVAAQAGRALELLTEGSALLNHLRGWARVAVAGYIAGGLATADALRRADWEVMAGAPRPGKRDLLVHLAGLLGGRRVGAVDHAYAVCESITKSQARNFYYGIRLLTRRRRAALCAVYALARRIDDLGDGDLPAEEKAVGLEKVRKSLTTLETATDPVLVAVADAARRFPIPLDAFDELLDGVWMDIEGRRYATFDELTRYCRCVAGSIGRLCLAVFASKPHPDAERYADALGIALQQTNILRDIREDLLGGRVYLPQEELDSFGVVLAVDGRNVLVDPDGRLSELIRHSARRAREWYAEGLRLGPLLDRRSAACCLAMAGIYRRLLDRIAERPAAVFDRRLSLSGKEKLGVAARALAGRQA